MGLFNHLLRPALFGVDAERAHGLSIKALKSGLLPFPSPVRDPKLVVKVAGLEIPNPLGLAAGYDKNAEVPDAMLKMGFGFTEVGTITPRAQEGNSKPRVFRLVEDNGVINRLGFNNQGHAEALKRLQARSGNNGIVGVNIGANKDSEDFVADYEKGIETFWDVATYFTANISSPNTPGLRNLQAKDALEVLLKRIFKVRSKMADETGGHKPVFLKIAPDLSNSELEEIAAVVLTSDLDGIIISNTTLSRTGLKSKANTNEVGGLSGAPLFKRSTIVLARMRKLLGPEMPIIGVGGIDSAETAIKKMEAGATLLQLYSGLVYQGPQLPGRIVSGLLSTVNERGMGSVSELTGTKVDDWANRNLNAKGGRNDNHNLA